MRALWCFSLSLPLLACGAMADTDSSGDSLRSDDRPDPTDGPLTLLVVFDTSGSMAQMWDGRSRWQAAYDSVHRAVSTYQDNLTVGAIVFPSDGGCGVAPIDGAAQMDFQPGPAFLATWEDRMKGPSGNTPLERGLREADAAITRAQARGLLEHRFRVMVLSDGEPTCSDDDHAIRQIPAGWYAKGIETYVLALPGSEVAAQLLDDIANAGGTGAEFGGGTAIVNDSNAQVVYQSGVETHGASRIIVEEEEDLDDVAHALAR